MSIIGDEKKWNRYSNFIDNERKISRGPGFGKLFRPIGDVLRNNDQKMTIQPIVDPSLTLLKHNLFANKTMWDKEKEIVAEDNARAKTAKAKYDAMSDVEKKKVDDDAKKLIEESNSKWMKKSTMSSVIQSKPNISEINKNSNTLINNTVQPKPKFMTQVQQVDHIKKAWQ